MGSLSFFIGLMVGGTLGVLIMCCFQINKENARRVEKEKEKEE